MFLETGMNESAQIAFVALLIAGLFLVGAEVFLPGGIIGILGALALVGAGAISFVAYGVQWGILISLSIVVLSAACVIAWIKWFPRTSMGRHLMLSMDGASFKSSETQGSLLGAEGVAETVLRPSGMARIGGQRLDVVADATWIPAGARVKVISMEGNRICVRRLETTEGGAP